MLEHEEYEGSLSRGGSWWPMDVYFEDFELQLV